jgi:hypothetical protein
LDPTVENLEAGRFAAFIVSKWRRPQTTLVAASQALVFLVKVLGCVAVFFWSLM